MIKLGLNLFVEILNAPIQKGLRLGESWFSFRGVEILNALIQKGLRQHLLPRHGFAGAKY